MIRRPTDRVHQPEQIVSDGQYIRWEDQGPGRCPKPHLIEGRRFYPSNLMKELQSHPRYDNDKTGSLNQSQLYQMVKDFADEIGAPEIHCQDCVRFSLPLF